VADEGGIDRSAIEGAVENLVNKSLVLVRPDRRGVVYRLFNTTRCYALEKLAASGEHHSIAVRHASHLSQLSQRGGIQDAAGRLRDIPGKVPHLQPASGEGDAPSASAR
jgi:predicted ATPase